MGVGWGAACGETCRCKYCPRISVHRSLTLSLVGCCSHQALCMRAQSLRFSHVQLFVTKLTIALQAPLSWDSPGKNTGVGSMYSSRGSSQPSDQTHISDISCIGWQVLYHSSHLGSPIKHTGRLSNNYN